MRISDWSSDVCSSDLANVEIKERVGDENIFIFGLTAEEVADLRAYGSFDPRATIEADPMLRRVLDMIGSGVFSPEDPGRFPPLVPRPYGHATYLVTADLAAYADAPTTVCRASPTHPH